MNDDFMTSLDEEVVEEELDTDAFPDDDDDSVLGELDDLVEEE
ncbi:MAG: hypothetical protein NUV65_05795 [Candidatus Roizmanbacteria bacterium]|nr:hypothetical protein [Candidatus Roizmanbacteria bacterium]